ncbi:MAG: hypothetical protein WD208_08140 [Dehalococcoidia bacterium]
MGNLLRTAIRQINATLESRNASSYAAYQARLLGDSPSGRDATAAMARFERQAFDRSITSDPQKGAY